MKDHKAQVLDDTIKYLKELRKRLNVNEADSTYKTTEASPASISSRGRKHGDGKLAMSPIHLEDLELETAGVEISPHLNVDNGPHIEVHYKTLKVLLYIHEESSIRTTVHGQQGWSLESG